jgi:hypothetical protein
MQKLAAYTPLVLKKLSFINHSSVKKAKYYFWIANKKLNFTL